MLNISPMWPGKSSDGLGQKLPFDRGVPGAIRENVVTGRRIGARDFG